MPTDTQIPARKRVLVAEDNKEMRDTIVHIVEREYDVVGAVSDGRSLVDAAAELRPDIGVFDISMPVMNGIEAAHEIKKKDSRMKIVFLTVNEDPDFAQAAFEAGGVAYVIKRRMAADLPAAIIAALTGQKFVSPNCGLPRAP